MWYIKGMEANTNNLNPNKHSVHLAMGQGYTTYFVLFLFGVFLDTFFHLELFSTPFAAPFGIFLLFMSTIVIFWAQITSRNLDVENLTKDTFCRGPYCYTRSPTHWGLFFLVLGFGVIANAFFVVVTTIISFLISKLVFLRKGEKILANKYGAPYLEYKKQVKL